jgi:hypothetical protein
LTELTGKIGSIVNGRLTYHADRLLDAQLRKDKDLKYVVEIDNRSAPDRSAFILATKRIRISFIERVLKVAIAELKAALENSISARASKQAWVNRGRVQSSVLVFYGGENKPIQNITATSKIESFSPGDFILLAPSYGTQMYANATKFGANHYMRDAAARIRSKLNINKSTARYSDFRVSAQRSRAVFYKLLEQGAPVRENGTRINITVPRPGMDSAWVIAIRLRKQNG